MFKPGDKIVCIDNYFDIISVNLFGDDQLTFEKVYTVSELMGGGIFIVLKNENDFGYSAERFISLKEYRKRKLDKLCLLSRVKR